MKPNDLTIYVQRADRSIVDLTREARARLGLDAITEPHRLDAIDVGFELVSTYWPEEVDSVRVWCYPQVLGSEHLFGPKGEWFG